MTGMSCNLNVRYGKQHLHEQPSYMTGSACIHLDANAYFVEMAALANGQSTLRTWMGPV